MNVIFTKDECEWLKTFYIEEEALDGSKPMTITSKNGETIEIKFRQGRKGVRGSYYHSNDPELISFLKERFKSEGVKNIDSVKFIKYNIGDVLGPHVDFGRYGVESNYKTIVVQLSDENDYKGGDLCLWGEPQERKQGTCVSFLRTVEHEVTEITDGVRFSMSLFLTEDDIEFTKSII